MKPPAALWFVLVTFHFTGCVGVGRSLVDHQDQVSPPDPLSCINLPSCDDAVSVRGSTLDDAVPVMLVAASSECIDPVPELCFRDPALPGAGLPAPVQCPASFSVEEGNPRELASLECTAIHIVARAEDAVDRLAIEHASWQHAHVAVESPRPLTVELSDAALRDVRIELRGPVSLQLKQAELRAVQVLGRPLAAEAPVLSLSESSSDDLTVRGEAGTFPGRVALLRSTLRRGWLGAQTLDMESVHVSDARIQADLFDADDAELEDVSLLLDEGRAVASTLRRSKVEECGALTLISVDVHSAVLGPCTEDRLRAYSVFAQESVLVGALESDGSDIRDSWLGTDVPTQLVSWNSILQRVALCSQTQASFGANSSVTCSTCAREASLCRDPDENVSLSLNDCPLLVEMPPCQEPLDEPGRP